MEDEILKGEFVRTKDGEIRKIIGIGKSTLNRQTIYCTDKDIIINRRKVGCFFHDELDCIVKKNKDIVKLLEIGDIIAGIFPHSEKFIYIENETTLEYIKGFLKNGFKITGVITKEQIENIMSEINEEGK